MKINVLIKIEDGNSQTVEVDAFGKDRATIFVTADTLQNAQALVIQAEDKALEAMKNWEPKEEPAEERVSRPAADPVMAEAKAYEKTPAGQRFIRQIENAKTFYHDKYRQHPRGGLGMKQMMYLTNKYRNNFINASFALSALEFRRGYMLGQKDAKAKKAR